MTTILCEYVNQKGSTVICLANEWNDGVIAIDVDNMEKTYLSSFPIDEILSDCMSENEIYFNDEYVDSLLQYLEEEENEELRKYIMRCNIIIYNEDYEEVLS